MSLEPLSENLLCLIFILSLGSGPSFTLSLALWSSLCVPLTEVIIEEQTCDKNVELRISLSYWQWLASSNKLKHQQRLASHINQLLLSQGQGPVTWYVGDAAFNGGEGPMLRSEKDMKGLQREGGKRPGRKDIE